MPSIINCNIVSKQCGEFRLENINFQLEPGYILGIIGVNGVGKTTLLRSILGSYLLDGEGNQGSVTIAGKDSVKDIVEYKEQIAYVIQDTPFDMWMTAVEIGRIYGRYYRSFDMEKYIELLREYQLPFEGREKSHMIKDMSLGQQIRQQLAFARAYDAKVYIFDEATGNLDVNFRESLYKEIRQLVSTEEKAVIYATHLVEEMEEFADYILWLQKQNNVGCMRFWGSMDELKNQYRIIEADTDTLSRIPKDLNIGNRITETHNEALIYVDEYDIPEDVMEYSRYATLKEIMYYVEKKRLFK